MLLDALTLAREFLAGVHRRDPAARYASIGANYLQPAGASIVHPHLQLLATPLPYSYHARQVRACAAHLARHGTSLLGDLAAEERRLAARYAARRGGWHWLAAWAPQGCNEVLAVHEVAQDVALFPDDDLLALADGISRVLRVYGEMGLLCFNYALYSVREVAAGDGFRLFLRVVSRQNLSPAYRNDDYFLQKLLQTDIVATAPEELAARLRAAF